MLKGMEGLILSQNKIVDDQILLPSLLQNLGLRHLDISHNKICPKSIEAIIDSIADGKCQKLEKLNIAHQECLDFTQSICIARMLDKKTSLKFLDIS